MRIAALHRGSLWGIAALVAYAALGCGRSRDEPIGIPIGVYGRWLHEPQETAGPWEPAWSPDGLTLAFSAQGSIWTVPAQGGIARQRTVSPREDGEPAWSPEGRSLAFVRGDGRDSQLALLELEGDTTRMLTRGPGLRLDPAWSPDGRSIAYAAFTPEGSGLWLVDPASETTHPLLADGWRSLSPTWSPDGRALAFASERRWSDDPAGGRVAIFRLSLGGREPRLRFIAPAADPWQAKPAWSPDGSAIAYAVEREGGRSLVGARAAGGYPTTLVHFEGEAACPAWSPDGERVAFGGSDERGPWVWTAIVGGETSPRRLQIDAWEWKEPVGRLVVDLREGGDRRVVAARVSVRGADGRAFTPIERIHRRSSTRGGDYFHARGHFALTLPVGRIRVAVSHGPEFARVDREVEVRANAETRLTVNLERRANLAAAGWISGDLHVHMNLGGTLRGNLAELRAMAAAEDLRIVHPLVANRGVEIYDRALVAGIGGGFDGDPPWISPGMELRPAFGGHVEVLGAAVRGRVFGGQRQTVFNRDLPSAGLGEIRAAGGFVSLAHPFAAAMRGYLPSGPGASEGERRPPHDAVELPVRAALGELDSIDLLSLWSDPIATMEVWYRLLDLGFRIPAAAGSDVMSDYWNHPPPGEVRVYAQVRGPVTLQSWLAALSVGRSFVTTGPLLLLEIEGELPGGQLPFAQGESLSGTLEAWLDAPASIEIVHNGRVIQQLDASSGHLRASLALELDRPGWIAARVIGEGEPGAMPPGIRFAHTNPIYLGRSPQADPAAARYFVRWIELAVQDLMARNNDASADERAALRERWDRGAALLRRRGQVGTSAGDPRVR